MFLSSGNNSINCSSLVHVDNLSLFFYNKYMCIELELLETKTLGSQISTTITTLKINPIWLLNENKTDSTCR